MTAGGEVPDTAMASGSDAGAPGDHPAPGALEPDEQRVLEHLQAQPRSTDPDAEAEARAAADDAPLPADGGDPGDGLSARFTEPTP